MTPHQEPETQAEHTHKPCIWRAWSHNIGWHDKVAQGHQWVNSYTGKTRACYRCWHVEKLVTPAVPAPELEIAELRKQAAPLLYAEQAPTADEKDAEKSSHTLTNASFLSMNPEQLWITLLKIEAATRNIDLSQVPECVLEHYAQQDLTVKQAIEKLNK